MPGVAVFFTWYVGYVVTAMIVVPWPGPSPGAVNVAMVAGLGQFLSTFPCSRGRTHGMRGCAGTGCTGSALGHPGADPGVRGGER